mmetsp:Transcript_8864/g.39048  ORF Transcript_8864/g.39048 Transcript_8864/m.39048 type:complete len:238 (-) Transcript_8864:705-1418(-)
MSTPPPPTPRDASPSSSSTAPSSSRSPRRTNPSAPSTSSASTGRTRLEARFEVWRLNRARGADWSWYPSAPRAASFGTTFSTRRKRAGSSSSTSGTMRSADPPRVASRRPRRWPSCPIPGDPTRSRSSSPTTNTRFAPSTWTPSRRPGPSWAQPSADPSRGSSRSTWEGTRARRTRRTPPRVRFAASRRCRWTGTRRGRWGLWRIRRRLAPSVLRATTSPCSRWDLTRVRTRGPPAG